MLIHSGFAALAALALVLALVVATRLLLTRFSGVGPALLRLRAAQPGRRLALRETLPLDGRRRLLLVSLDGREFLLLTGGPNDLLLSGREGVA